MKVITGERVEEIVGSSSADGYVKTIKTNANRQIDTDFILLGTGVRPNSEIAKDAGIELGFADAIKVDEYMRTNVPDIFAVEIVQLLEAILQMTTHPYLWEQLQTSRDELQERTRLVEVQGLGELLAVL